MKHIDFEFNAKPCALSFTAEALFAIYDKFGVCDDILEASQAFEPTQEGFVNLCWLVALFAAQGELQRRHLGETPREMLTLEDVRTAAMASDVPRLRAAVRACLEQGFAHEPSEAEKREQETFSLRHIGDNFRKVVVTGDPYEKPWTDRNGVTFIGIMPFLLDPRSLETL